MSTLERAIAIAAEAHLGQTDRAGEPYILHPLRVMFGVHSEQERIVDVGGPQDYNHQVAMNDNGEWVVRKKKSVYVNDTW